MLMVAFVVQMPAVVARYGGKPELLLKAHDAIRTHQESTETRLVGLAFARILERLLLGQSLAVCSMHYRALASST